MELAATAVFKPDIIKVPLRKVVEEILDEAKLAIGQRGLKTQVDIADGADEVLGGHRDVRVLLENVIDNAIKFTRAGQIAISSRPKDKWVEVTVSDTGCGIRSEDKNKVFDRFYKRFSSAGVGLGLAICKDAINRIGGTIAVESEGEGKGTTVIIKLPKA